ncbi:MAG: LacI family transcriptional regulator [Gammaproteobacteria bacterium HGW-Gammaproteobacteria-7]|nr:MAG: LacI family transcriptional regulator [Gammaproteobacteria bacterium HGW-Gammaproteobacteria-7]
MPPRKRSESEPSRTLNMADIAKAAGVSESTVSRALADNPVVSARTRAHVQKIASEAGYRINPIARSLRSRRTGIISVAIPLVHQRDPHLSDPFMMTMLALLADELTGRGYSMLLSKTARHQDGWVQDLVRAGHADGVIVVGQSLEHEAINAAAAQGIPVVAWGERLPGQHYPSVGSDNSHGAALATRHLIEHGRERIAFLGDDRVPEAASRLAGYRAELERHGRPVQRALQVRAGFEADEAYRDVKAMLTKGGRPDGVLACSDVIALSAIRALSEAGLRVPQDVSVIGFDDVALAAYSHPSLTTVRQNLPQAARELVEKVLASIAGERPESTVLATELIIRESA